MICHLRRITFQPGYSYMLYFYHLQEHLAETPDKKNILYSLFVTLDQADKTVREFRIW